MDAGDYVPDEVTNAWCATGSPRPTPTTGFLLDGYPRTLAQVDELDAMLERRRPPPRRGRGADRRHRTRSSQRLAKRAEAEGRADDTEEVIRHRQEVYTEQTAPLIEVYRERGLLVEVDGMGAVDEVTAAGLRRPSTQTNGAATS